MLRYSIYSSNPYIYGGTCFSCTLAFVLCTLKEVFFSFLVMGNLCYLHIAKLVPQVCCEILLGILQFVIHVMQMLLGSALCFTDLRECYECDLLFGFPGIQYDC